MTNLLFVSYSSKISSNRVNFALPYVWLLTSSVLSATSKQCFEQPAASFLVCSLIFIEYKTLKSCPFKVFLIQINEQSYKVARHHQARYGIYQKE